MPRNWRRNGHWSHGNASSCCEWWNSPSLLGALLLIGMKVLRFILLVGVWKHLSKQQNLTILPRAERSFRRTEIRKTVNPSMMSLMISSIGPCDVTSKEDLEKLVRQISEKEKYLNLLSLCNLLSIIISSDIIFSHKCRHIRS